MTFDILYLGTQAALPHRGYITTSQVITVHDNLYLMDCGEGTQMKMAQWHVRRNRITAVFISHLHGDHIFGLPGLITSFAHFQRKQQLTLIGPTGLREWVDTSIRLSESYLGFPLVIRELDHEGCSQVFEDAHISVSAFPLAHRIQTYGYRLDEKVSLNIIREMIESYSLTPEQIRLAREKLDVNVKSGEKVPWQALVTRKYAPRSYAFCTDTALFPGIIPHIRDVDVVYHEATYLSDLQSQAAERMHSTARDAAYIARDAGAEHLVLGHFSSRYGDLQPFVDEATALFPKVTIAVEGTRISIDRKPGNQFLH